MHRPRRSRALVVAPAMAVTLAAALTLGGQITAAASTSATTDDIPGVARTLTASTAVGFPTGQHIATDKSYQAPEFPKDAEGAAAKSVTRSHSIRPSGTAAVSTAAGTLGQPPVVASTNVSATTPGLNRSFHALDLFDQRYANGGNQFSAEPRPTRRCAWATVTSSRP